MKNKADLEENIYIWIDLRKQTTGQYINMLIIEPDWNNKI